MKNLLSFILVFSCFSVAEAQALKKKKIDPDVEKKIREAVGYNFDACNREDIDDVMDSCADAMPDRDKFRRETLKVFAEKDIHYSLGSLEVLEVRHPFALVKMVQISHTLDRDSDSKDDINYRNQTGLVTQESAVEYLNTLKCENETWKLLLIVSEMKPVKPVKAKSEEETEINCANGRCRPTPFNLEDARRQHNFKPPQR